MSSPNTACQLWGSHGFCVSCRNWWSFLCQDRPMLLQTLNNPTPSRQCLNLALRSWAGAAARGLSWVEVARGWQMLMILPYSPIQAFQGFGRGSACNLKGSLDSAFFLPGSSQPHPQKGWTIREASQAPLLQQVLWVQDKYSQSQGSECRNPSKPADGKEL